MKLRLRILSNYSVSENMIIVRNMGSLMDGIGVQIFNPSISEHTFLTILMFSEIESISHPEIHRDLASISLAKKAE